MKVVAKNLLTCILNNGIVVYGSFRAECGTLHCTDAAGVAWPLAQPANYMLKKDRKKIYAIHDICILVYYYVLLIFTIKFTA